MNRQYIIQRNVTRQIQNEGTSRILRLRNVPPAITPDVLRADLEHIANLHIERLTQKGREIVCNLNSVGVAMFARTCLRSRATYKGAVIEYGVDDCALRKMPIEGSGGIDEEEAPSPARARNVKNARRNPNNRFSALQLVDDGGEEGDQEETDIGTNGAMSWADSMSTSGTITTEDSNLTATEDGVNLEGYWA